MCIGRDGENETSFKDICYENNKEEVVLGITIDNRFNFLIVMEERGVKQLVKN